MSKFYKQPCVTIAVTAPIGTGTLSGLTAAQRYKEMSTQLSELLTEWGMTDFRVTIDLHYKSVEVIQEIDT